MRRAVVIALLLLGAGCESEPGIAGDVDAEVVVSADGGTAADAEVAAPATDAAAMDTHKAVVTGTGTDGLNLREGPAVTFAIIKTLPEGTVVDVVGGPQGDWWQVSHEGDIGWVNGTFLMMLPPGTEPPVGTPGLDFLLPWTGGVAFQVTQGHNTGSHTDKGSWAWDFGMARGTTVRAAHDGRVRLVRGNSNVGGCSSAYANDANYVVVDRGDGFESLYLHLDSASATVGQTVKRGDVLGLSGQTGWSCGAHLHFQIQKSPTGGGGATWYNQSVAEKFHDTGAPVDYAAGTRPVSANAR